MYSPPIFSLSSRRFCPALIILFSLPLFFLAVRPTAAQGQKRTKCNPFGAAASSSSPAVRAPSAAPPSPPPRPIIKLLFSTTAAFWTEQAMMVARPVASVSLIAADLRLHFAVGCWSAVSLCCLEIMESTLGRIRKTDPPPPVPWSPPFLAWYHYHHDERQSSIPVSNSTLLSLSLFLSLFLSSSEIRHARPNSGEFYAASWTPLSLSLRTL